ncbi:MAG: glycosyltransferase family 2 protein [Chitinispirillaceae bacterium]
MSSDVAVCVCTYKRPRMLRGLLLELNKQKAEGIRFSVTVVDNDVKRSAQPELKELRKSLNFKVRYVNEPRKNIAKARNAAVRNAHGEYIAFIDDDEFPGEHWLRDMLEVCRERKVEGVLGPVLPHYDEASPKWLRKSGLCDRKRFPTGTVLKNTSLMRTGNVLLSRRFLEEHRMSFDEKYGLTGGEDTDFFRRALNKGGTFVWCDEAGVYEYVPLERSTRKYHLERALLRGTLNARKVGVLSMPVLKSSVAVLFYLPALPVLFLLGHDFFMRYLVKSCDHVGRLCGVFGVELVKDRSFQG